MNQPTTTSLSFFLSNSIIIIITVVVALSAGSILLSPTELAALLYRREVNKQTKKVWQTLELLPRNEKKKSMFLLAVADYAYTHTY